MSIPSKACHSPKGRRKSVHFDVQFDVRYFSSDDCPEAVSAIPSPEPEQWTDIDQLQLIGWEMQLPDIGPVEVPTAGQPVRLQRIWTSADQQHLCGFIGVRNLAFDKTVALRYTVDNWKVVSEQLAEYSSSAPGHPPGATDDRFEFSLDLRELPRLKTRLKLCVRYRVGDRDFWDNNGGANYEVLLTPARMPQHTGPAQGHSQARFDDNIDARHLRMLLSIQHEREAEKSGAESPGVVPQTIQLQTTEYNQLLRNYCFYNGGSTDPSPHGDNIMRAEAVLSDDWVKDSRIA